MTENNQTWLAGLSQTPAGSTPVRSRISSRLGWCAPRACSGCCEVSLHTIFCIKRRTGGAVTPSAGRARRVCGCSPLIWVINMVMRAWYRVMAEAGAAGRRLAVHWPVISRPASGGALPLKELRHAWPGSPDGARVHLHQTAAHHGQTAEQRGLTAAEL